MSALKLVYIGKGSMEILWRNYMLTFQVISTMWPFANKVTGQLSSPHRLVHNGTRTREQEAVSHRRQKGIAEVLSMVGLTDRECGRCPKLRPCSLFPSGLYDPGRERVLHLGRGLEFHSQRSKGAFWPVRDSQQKFPVGSYLGIPSTTQPSKAGLSDSRRAP